MTNTPQEPDVVDVLSTDHSEFTALIAQIKAASDAEQRRDLADTLISEVVRHSVAEEMFVYPVMREELPNGNEAVSHDTKEHKHIETLMKQLEGTETGDARFDELVAELEQVLRDHAADEESQQFPMLRASLPRERLVAMAGRVETAKKAAPTRPHPASPNNEVFHKLVGPGVGLVDRLRDRLSGRSTG